MYNILSVKNNPADTALEIAQRVKARRLELNLTQEGIALRSGIPLATFKRFERCGEISLKGLLKIGFALDLLDDFDKLFVEKKYQTLEDVLDEYKPRRKRGRINE